MALQYNSGHTKNEPSQQPGPSGHKLHLFIKWYVYTYLDVRIFSVNCKAALTYVLRRYINTDDFNKVGKTLDFYGPT